MSKRHWIQTFFESSAIFKLVDLFLRREETSGMRQVQFAQRFLCFPFWQTICVRVQSLLFSFCFSALILICFPRSFVSSNDFTASTSSAPVEALEWACICSQAFFGGGLCVVFLGAVPRGCNCVRNSQQLEDRTHCCCFLGCRQ
jgi:hypothetical protein